MSVLDMIRPPGRQQRWRHVIVAAMLSAVVAAGCSGGQGDAGPGPSPTAAAPTDRATATTAPVVGAQSLGVKWDWPRVQQYTPYLRRLAGGSTFYELVWCEVEPQPGEQDWSRVDQIVRQAGQLGFTIHLKIRVGSCWLTGGQGQHVRGAKQKTESLPPEDMGAYERFVRDAVRRYAPMGVHQYAIENEINGESMWGGSPDQYVQLATVAAKAIRSEDPKAVVVDPGISSTAYGWAIAQSLLDQGRVDEAVRAYSAYYERRFSTRGRELPQVSNGDELRAALTGQQAQRNLTYLDVVHQLAKRRVFDVYQLHFYEKWSNVPAVLGYLRSSLPSGMPIEAWEVGMFWPDGGSDERMRADEATKTVTGLLRGGVRQVIWLPLADDTGGRHPEEVRYGLLDSRGDVREAGNALATLALTLRSSR